MITQHSHITQSRLHLHLYNSIMIEFCFMTTYTIHDLSQTILSVFFHLLGLY